MRLKLTAVLLILALILSLLPGSALGAPPEEGFYTPVPGSGLELRYEALPDGTLCITGCTGGHPGDLTLPSSIKGRTVTGIARYAFGFKTDIEGILTVPASVTSIQEGAFAGYSGTLAVDGANSRYCVRGGLLLTKDLKTLLACPVGTAGSLELPDTVSRIGEAACLNCARLTGTLHLPASLESIGTGAFNGCFGLTGPLALPDRTREVGPRAFLAGQFTSLRLSPGLETNGSQAFASCRYLTGSLELPRSLQAIGSSAFSGCVGLTGALTLPQGVTVLEENVFRGCGFTRLTLGDQVQHLDDRALSCPRLEEVFFTGPRPPFIASAAFEGVTAQVHYPRGWGTSVPGQYGGSLTWIPEDGFAPLPPVVSRPIPEDQYAICVVDSYGVPLAGAEVTWNSQTLPTEADGTVFFPLATLGQPVITVQKAGFLPWTNRETNWQKNPDHYDVVVLFSNRESKCALASAVYSNTPDFLAPTDVLTRTKKLSLGSPAASMGPLDFGNFYLSCAALSPDHAAAYELWQGPKRISQSPDGSFTLHTAKFAQGAGCFIRVLDYEGRHVDTAINLEFAQTPKNGDGDLLDLPGDKISFQVGDEVPYLGGARFSFDLPIQCPVTFLVGHDGKDRLGFNVNLAGDEDADTKLLKINRSIAELRSMKPGSKIPGSWRNSVETLMKSKNKLTFFRDGSVDLLGYAEVDTGSSVARGQMAIVATIDAVEFGYSTFVYIVPVTVRVGLELGCEALGEVRYDWENATLTGELDLNPSAELEAFGGLGVGTVLSGGAYGSAKLEGKIRMVGRNPGLKSVDLTGDLGIKAYAANFELSKSYAYNTWNLYTENTVQAPTRKPARPAALLLDPAAYRPADLSYLSASPPWNGEGTPGDRGLRTLQEQIYRNAQPALTAGPQGLYGAFLSADPRTGAVEIRLTRFDGSTWSRPVSAMPGLSLADAPCLFTDREGTVWLAFTREGPGTGSDSLRTAAAGRRVVAGTVDPLTLAFTPCRIQGGSGYVHEPQLVSLPEGCALLWLDTTLEEDRDVLFPPAGSVCSMTFDGKAWSGVRALARTDLPVLSMTPGAPEGILTAACILDGDGSPDTAGDRSLYALSAQGTRLLAPKCTGRVSWGSLPGGEEAVFLWNEPGLLRASDGRTVPAPELTEAYALLGNRLYYAAAQAAALLTRFSQMLPEEVPGTVRADFRASPD